MKHRASVRAFKERKGCQMVIRRDGSGKRRILIINKLKPKLNVKQ